MMKMVVVTEAAAVGMTMSAVAVTAEMVMVAVGMTVVATVMTVIVAAVTAEGGIDEGPGTGWVCDTESTDIDKYKLVTKQGHTVIGIVIQ
jgi:hypothetical protein